MGVDLAKLVIAVDASQAGPAAAQLDTLTAAGTRAEASTGKLKTATETLAAATRSGGTVTSQMIKNVGGYSAAQAIMQEAIAKTTKAEELKTAAIVSGESAAAAAAVDSAAVQVAAHKAVAGSSQKIRETLVLLREASVGNFTRMAGSASILAAAFGLVNTVLLPAIAIGAALGAVFLVATQQINKGSGDLTKGLGLTADQLDRVKQRTVTFGDTVKATFQVWKKDILAILGDDVVSTVGKAFNAIVKTIADYMAIGYGIIAGTLRLIVEAWKSLPTWLGGDNKSFSFGDLGKAFTTGLNEARKAVHNFYSDVADQARKNRVAEILKEAGKPGRTPGQGEVDRAAKQLTETQNQLTAQTALNKAVQDGTLSVAAANEQTKIDGQLKSVIAERDNASGVVKQKLTAIINQLIPVTKKLIDAQKEYRVLQDIDKQEKTNDLLREEISLAGKSIEQRAVAIAQFKQMQTLGLKPGDKQTPAQAKLIGLAGQGASLSYSNDLINSVANDNVDAGESAGRAYALTIRANDPNAAYKQQQASYAAIDKLRKADVLSEKEAARAKLLADNEYNRARLEGVSSMFGALASLQDSSNKELAAIGKAAAITQATIDGVLAVQKALASAPPPINYINAAAVGIAAAVNVAKIAGLKDGGLVQGAGGPRDDKVLLWGSNGEFMVNAAATARNRPLLEAMNSGMDVSRGNLPARANGGYIGPTGPANSNANRPHIEINNYGTSKGFEVQHVTDDHIRIIARDEDHKNTPEIMAKETANRNSKFRRTLGQHTRTQNKMAS